MRLLLLVALLAMPLCFAGTEVASTTVAGASSAIVRIRAATLVVPEASRVASWYRDAFGYSIVEEGEVSESLARSWAAPRVAGRRYTVLASRGSPDVFLRIVQAAPNAPPPERRPSFGWSSLEFVVADLGAVRERLRVRETEVFREPASLGPPFESIFAMQARGPAAQTLNLTLDTADPERSNLPRARSLVDRLFLVGLNGPDLEAMRAFYTNRLGMRGFPNYDQAIPSLAKELGLPPTEVFPMSLVRAAQKGNTLEFHGLPPPAAQRPFPTGDLPAGVAIVSLEVQGIDGFDVQWIAPPKPSRGRVYGGRVAATTIGPAGERIELIAAHP
jgi:catechol 2,3-dioxygenase-like lactoylglutathione lyase family enzyme